MIATELCEFLKSKSLSLIGLNRKRIHMQTHFPTMSNLQMHYLRETPVSCVCNWNHPWFHHTVALHRPIVGGGQAAIRAERGHDDGDGAAYLSRTRGCARHRLPHVLVYTEGKRHARHGRERHADECGCGAT